MVNVSPIRKIKEIPKINIKALSTPVTKLDAFVVVDRIYISFYLK
jgi:hypothetical protein